MPVLTVEDLSKDYRNKPLFHAVTFGVDWTDRVGVIGANGSGKTTLLKIIAGEETSDQGRVILAEGSVLGYLPQNPTFDPELSVLDTIFQSQSSVIQLLSEYEAACARLTHEDHDPKLVEEVGRLSERLDAANAWTLEAQAKAVLTRLGISELDQKMSELSGGQRKRVAMAHALITQPDLLILDEPTNHLDAETIEWLEDYLKRYTGALLLVTHDRYFLDRVTDRIIEIDRGTLQTFSGNYSYYLQKKQEQETVREAEGVKREALIRRELAWLRRGAKARTTKQKARIDRAEELMAMPKETAKAEIEISMGSRRLGTQIVEFENVTKSYDPKVLIKDFSYVVPRGDRIGIIGPNGSGKTTLLDMIVGHVFPDKGQIKVGQTVAIGFYDQESRTLDDNQRVIDYVKELGENVKTADGSTISASQLLERFLFPPAMQYAVIGKLSGGERRRLYLLRILMTAPNVLLLDEPTNDLDIQTMVTLEDYLDDFGGCLIVVSHDRYFLDRTVSHLFRFEGDGRIREYPGNYSAFLEIRDREAAEAARPAVQKVAPKVEAQLANKSRKLSYKEKKELEDIEKRIASGEKRKQTLEQQLANSAGDYAKLSPLLDELKTLSDQMEKDLERWASLAELAET